LLLQEQLACDQLIAHALTQLGGVPIALLEQLLQELIESLLLDRHTVHDGDRLAGVLCQGSSTAHHPSQDTQPKKKHRFFQVRVTRPRSIRPRSMGLRHASVRPAQPLSLPRVRIGRMQVALNHKSEKSTLFLRLLHRRLTIIRPARNAK
jgi:hypothetical protein